MKDPAANRFGPRALPDAVKIAEAKDEDEVIPAQLLNLINKLLKMKLKLKLQLKLKLKLKLLLKKVNMYYF